MAIRNCESMYVAHRTFLVDSAGLNTLRATVLSSCHTQGTRGEPSAKNCLLPSLLQNLRLLWDELFLIIIFASFCSCKGVHSVFIGYSSQHVPAKLRHINVIII